MDRPPRLVGEIYRMNVASAVALVVTMVAFAPAMVARTSDIDQFASFRDWWGDYLGDLFVPLFLVFWVLFSAVHVALTHRVFARMTPSELRRAAGAQRQVKRSWWRSLLGDVSAESWTIQGALVAAVGVLAIAQTDQFRGSVWMLLLGLAASAGSWTLMVFQFAIRYLRIDVGRAALEFDLLGEPRFQDYLTLSVLTSTMSGSGVRCRTSTSWTAMRTHSLLAFAFNTVIVAMTVSLLVGSFGA